MKRANEENKIILPWWRFPLVFLFPDKKFDGQLENPGSERIFDFNDVMALPSPFTEIAQDIVYYPENDRREFYGVFISGLGQSAKESSKRSRRYANTLDTGIANMNNSTFLKMHPIFAFINRYLDWINAGLERINLSGSPVIENAAILINYAIDHKITLNFSGDSLGTILLARAIREAKNKFINKHAHFFDFRQKKIMGKTWENQASELINIFTFGNAYLNWIKGPNYIMVFIEGDIVPAKFGITPAKAAKQKRDDIRFLIFPRLFPQGSFEAHNMMFTTQLLRQTFIKNHIEVGDFMKLYNKLHEGILEVATANEVSWPSDMKDYTWNPNSLRSIPSLSS